MKWNERYAGRPTPEETFCGGTDCPSCNRLYEALDKATSHEEKAKIHSVMFLHNMDAKMQALAAGNTKAARIHDWAMEQSLNGMQENLSKKSGLGLGHPEELPPHLWNIRSWNPGI